MLGIIPQLLLKKIKLNYTYSKILNTVLKTLC